MPHSNRLGLLIVINRPDVVTAIVRAVQYRELFAASDRFAATYVTRIPHWLVRLSQSWPQRRSMRWMIQLLERSAMAMSDRRILQAAKSADIVYAITMSSRDLQRAIQQQPVTYVMDIIDGLWLPWFRQFGWDHFESMLTEADGIIAENRFTAEHLRQYNPRVQLVPDSPQLGVFEQRRTTVQRDSRQVVLGWIGGKDSVDALYVVYEALERLFAEFPHLHLKILGAPRDRLPRFEHVRYSAIERYEQATMVREALTLDIGMYPQFAVQESVHRGTLKAKIYMSAGAATICQNLGENAELIQDGVNGMLAANTQEWYEKLRWLIEHPAERARIGAQGLETIRSEYSVERCFERLTTALETLHREHRGRAG